MRNFISGDKIIGADSREWTFKGNLPAMGLHFVCDEEEVYLTPKQAELFSERGMPSGIELQVCLDISARQKKGFKKYGVSVEKNPLNLKDWTTHFYEEILDAAIYAKRMICELEKNQAVNIEDLVMAHRYLYYIKNYPVLSDKDYDVLESVARKILPETSPVHLVGSDSIHSYTNNQIDLARKLLGDKNE